MKNYDYESFDEIYMLLDWLNENQNYTPVSIIFLSGTSRFGVFYYETV